jgi:predicted PurR-regulated permease PerM
VSEPSSPDSFWRGVKQEAAAGLVVLLAGGAITGIGYLVYTVPSQLERVIQNQEQFKARVGELEDTVKDHDVRIIKLELRR